MNIQIPFDIVIDLEEILLELKSNLFYLKILVDVDGETSSENFAEWWSLLYDCEARLQNSFSELYSSYNSITQRK